MSKIKPVKAWVGVVDGEIDRWDDRIPVFRSKSMAMQFYESVIRVEIRPVEKKKGKVK